MIRPSMAIGISGTDLEVGDELIVITFDDPTRPAEQTVTIIGETKSSFKTNAGLTIMKKTGKIKEYSTLVDYVIIPLKIGDGKVKEMLSKCKMIKEFIHEYDVWRYGADIEDLKWVFDLAVKANGTRFNKRTTYNAKGDEETRRSVYATWIAQLTGATWCYLSLNEIKKVYAIYKQALQNAKKMGKATKATKTVKFR